MKKDSSSARFMKLAIKKAREGALKGQSPFGACIVKNGEVVALAHNVVWRTTDITAHAEVTAIREACKKLKTIDLSGCEIYTTTEPCPMCFSAIHWAKIDKIYSGTKIKDAQNTGFNELTVSNKKLKKWGKSKVKITEDVLKKECQELFTDWLKSKKKKVYQFVSLEDLIKNLPKAELHIHIEGSLEPELMFEIAKRNKINLSYSSVEELKTAYNFHNL